MIYALTGLGSLQEAWIQLSGFGIRAQGLFSCYLFAPRWSTNHVSRACLGVLSGHSGVVTRLILRDDTLLSADSAGLVKVWSLDNAPGRTISEEKGGSVISLVADEENTLIGNTNGTVYLVNHVSGATKSLVTGADAVWNVGFTPSNRPLSVYLKGGDTQLNIF